MQDNRRNTLLYFITTCLFLLSAIVNNVEAVTCAYTTAPEQIHLALRPGGMTVSWVTAGYSRDTDTPSREVRYGTNSTNLTDSSSTGSSSSYYPEVGYRKFFHNVFLDGLQPATKYYYRISGSARCANASDIRYFTTAPTAGANPNLPLKITAIGDVSVNPIFNISGAIETFAALKNSTDDSNLLLFVGDLGYGDFFVTLYPDMHDYENILNDFGRRMDPIASYLPVEVIPGNHELTCNLLNGTYCPTYLRHYNAYFNRYWMSGDLSGGYKNLWYSFDYGPMHVIMLNMETDFPSAPSGPGSLIDENHVMGTGTQVGWFLADIAAANATAKRSKIPWLIVTGHRSFGGSKSIPSGPPKPGKRALLDTFCVACRNAFMSYFASYYVDVYFTGHIHWTELLYPLTGTGEVANTSFTSGYGWIHSTIGGGGPPGGADKVQYVEANVSYWLHNDSSFQNFYIKNSTHATLEHVESRNMSVIKSVDIVRRR